MEARKAMETKHMAYVPFVQRSFTSIGPGALCNLCAAVSKAGASRLLPRFGITEDKR